MTRTSYAEIPPRVDQQALTLYTDLDMPTAADQVRGYLTAFEITRPVSTN